MGHLMKVCARQPPGFEVIGSEDKVYRLKKALYGLKLAPRPWNKRIDSFLMQQGFEKCTNEYEVYVGGTIKKNLFIICLYVDDLLVIGSSEAEIAEFKSKTSLNLKLHTWEFFPIFLV